jgi:hypothetical protein
MAHHEGTDPMLKGEGDHLLGRSMMGLMDAAAMPGLGLPHPVSKSAPAA